MLRAAKLALWPLLLGATLFCGPPATAHHSFTNTYSTEMVTIEGRVVEFLYRDPHSLVLVETSGDKRQATTWAAEWHTAGQLSREGIEQDTLKPGDHVIIRGNPSRKSTDHRLRLLEISRPSDGWKWTG